jgi:hypothetical protein
LIAKISAESARGHAEQAKKRRSKAQLELQKVPCKAATILSNMSHEIAPNERHHWIYKGDYED